MRRAGLLAAAAAFFVWENVAFVRWLGEQPGLAAGLAHAWAVLRQDTLVLLVFTDMGVFTLLAIAWLATDLRRGGASATERAAWIAATLVVGSPALLVYLARRARRPAA